MITFIIKSSNAKSISNQFALLTTSGRVNLKFWTFSIMLSSLFVSIPYFCKIFQNTFESSDLSAVQNSVFCFWVIDKNLGGIAKYFVTITVWLSSFTWSGLFIWNFKNGSCLDGSDEKLFGTIKINLINRLNKNIKLLKKYDLNVGAKFS